jgi:hypothetical protein
MADFFDAIADEFNSRFKRKNTAHDNEFVGFNGRGKVISRHALTPDRGIIASSLRSLRHEALEGFRGVQSVQDGNGKR